MNNTNWKELRLGMSRLGTLSPEIAETLLTKMAEGGSIAKIKVTTNTQG